MNGTLYVVATPLGNLRDLSDRAADTLRTVKVVAAEDTRRTRRLLNHLGTSAKLISLPAYAEKAKAGKIVAQLENGVDVALVTDAGTPGVSDPGSGLVRIAAERGVEVVAIPGPSAVVTALSASGFSADRYLFLGFPPRKGASRRDLLRTVAEAPWTVVLYEAANRLDSLLGDLAEHVGPDRPAAVARELTKIHEEVRRGTLLELRDHFASAGVKGEITLVIGGQRQARPKQDPDEIQLSASELLAQGLPTKEIVRQLTESWGLSRNEGYRLVTRLS